MTRKKIKFRVSAKDNPQVASYLKAARMGSYTQQVIQKDDGQWAVRKIGSTKSTRIFSTKKEAVNYGEGIAKKHGAGVLVD